MSQMVDARVKTSAEALKAKVDEVSAQVTSMKKHFEEMENIVSGTNGYWTGEAGALHRKLYNEQKENVEEIFKRLEEHPKDILALAFEGKVKATEVSEALPGDILE